MPEPHSWPRSISPTEWVLVLILHPGRRVSALLVLGYVTGIAGILLSFVGDPANPSSTFGVAGIVLMGTSFLCLFVLSVTIVNLDPDA